jgi:GTPase
VTHPRDPGSPIDEDGAPTRAGFVALVGRPNAGKSTLLNRVIGEHLSIVTAKAQTTWQRVTGIHTTDASQIVFLDTPGLLEARDLLQKAMLGAALEALADADVVLVVIDATRPPTAEDEARLGSALEGVRAPVRIALNKVDEADGPAVESWRLWVEKHLNAPVHPISAQVGTGVEELVQVLESALPVGPFLYPDDEIASQPVRFFVEELVRETVFEQYHQEIPYSVVCRVGEFREGEDPIYIQIDVHVERKSQKGILIGNKGAAIRALGTESRRKIEHFLGRRVYLDLWVKPLGAWRKDRRALGELGYHVPDPDDS